MPLAPLKDPWHALGVGGGSGAGVAQQQNDASAVGGGTAGKSAKGSSAAIGKENNELGFAEVRNGQ